MATLRGRLSTPDSPEERPVIAIPMGYARVHGTGGYISSFTESTHIVKEVWLAGGFPSLLPPYPELTSLASGQIDGLLLSGGADVEPRHYGGSAPATVEYDSRRDSCELALVDTALQRDWPILGVCRGLQLLTVAAGGSLYQDLESETSYTGHVQRQAANNTAHEVTIDTDSKLAGVVEATRIEVNSIHHQGVAEPGSGFRSVGHAPDGLVEAVESPDRSVLGVQWHPEYIARTNRAAAALFEWLVAQATQRRG
jgi:putative glutamine amidotransferase